MRHYIDLDSLQLIEAPGIRTPVTQIRAKRGTAPKLQIQFCRSGEPELLPEGTVIRFGPKPTGEYDGEFVVFTNVFTAPGDVTGFYEARPNFNTDELNALLGSPDATVANDEDSVTLMAEFSWRLGSDAPEKTETFAVVVSNAVDNGNESAPVPAGPDVDSRLSAIESANGATKKHGRTAITTGEETVTVTFTTAFSAAPSAVLTPTVERATAGTADVPWCTGISDRTDAGFIAYLSAPAPAGCHLHWLAFL